MQVIIPGNRARGTYAYRAATVSHPETTMETDQAAGPSSSIAPLPTTSSAVESDWSVPHLAESRFLREIGSDSSKMELDNPVQSSGFMSTSKPSSSKRSYAAMSSESGVPHSALTGQSDPISKKFKGSELGSPPSGSGVVKRTSTTVARPVKAITQATAVVGMQGSINQLTDIFEKSLEPSQDPSVNRKSRALKLVQERDDGLLLLDKVKLISIFDEHTSMIDTYLGLTDDELRRAWISSILRDKV